MSGIGHQLGRSLVDGLGQDCGAAATLARIAAARPGAVIRRASVGEIGSGAILRVAEDFVRRGWLTPCEGGWIAPPSGGLPGGLSAFLDGATAMQASQREMSRATAAVSWPTEPSAIAAIVPTLGVNHGALVSTTEAFARVAAAAEQRLTILTPFLNDEGLVWALDVFGRTPAQRRCLTVRAGTAVRDAVTRRWGDLIAAGIHVLAYNRPTDEGEGYETFHAKVVLADSCLAYVGSANLLAYARSSLELGIVVDGKAAQVVATVVCAIERAAVPFSVYMEASDETREH